MEQRSPEWFAARCGKATASRVADITAKTKSGPSALRANYAAQLVAERLTGKTQEGFSNAAMQWGTDNEADARAAYAFWNDAQVAEVGFVPHPNIGMAGASPDGLVGDDGLVEIKCPNTATHIETLLNGGIPAKYHVQMQWQMACTGRQWCDFVSFDPRMPESMRLFVQRIHRDDERITELEAEVAAFLREVDTTVIQLSHKYEPETNPLPVLMAG
jgi:putative phage-type endonuclease